LIRATILHMPRLRTLAGRKHPKPRPNHRIKDRIARTRAHREAAAAFRREVAAALALAALAGPKE